MTAKPATWPLVPNFASGPCAKRPGWTVRALEGALVGRSHRSRAGRARLAQAIELTREVLEVPPEFRIAIVPASDTGAVEAALWSLLGARGVDVLAWESFGEGWAADVTKQLALDDVRVLRAPYGALPDLAAVDGSRDVVFTWNGTTSGVRVPDGEWIESDREGLTICDATSAAFAQPLPWDRLDAVTFSWQKALGGEAGHGMLILGPRAVSRLETHVPPWPLPKIFRLTRGGRLDEDLFRGETINTPSMLCVEDYLDALAWAKSVGGLAGLAARADANLARVVAWVDDTPWVRFLARDPATRSNTSVCLEIVDPAVTQMTRTVQAAFVTSMALRLEREGAAFDVAGHRDAPPNLRVWCGATVEADDVEAVLPWLDWAFAETTVALPLAA